eukprot:3695932-Pleurochrysis_carterae.AAC.2
MPVESSFGLGPAPRRRQVARDSWDGKQWSPRGLSHVSEPALLKYQATWNFGTRALPLDMQAIRGTVATCGCDF